MWSLQDQILIGLTVALIVAVIGAVLKWLWSRFPHLRRAKLHIATKLEKGPSSFKLGFTETAVKITVINKSSTSVVIHDIRLMFSRYYGTAVFDEAPDGRCHPKLPFELPASTEERWYIPAEKLSGLLYSLHKPTKDRSPPPSVKLYVQCLTGNDNIYRSRRMELSTDANSL